MKLADICEINPRAEVLDDNTLVSFVAMPDVSEDGKINVDTYRAYGEVKKGFTNFKEGDVLFAKITPCMENGKGALATGLENGLGFGSTEFHVLRPNVAIVLGEWLYYLTSWSAFRKDAEKHMTGSAGQKRVPKSFLEKYEVDVPPIDDQEYQVLQLNRIRKIIDARRQQLSALDDLIKARFVEMFGDPVLDTKKWGKKPLLEMLESIRYGASTPPTFANEGYAFIRATNIKNGRIIDEDMKFIPQNEATKLGKCKLSGGELLIVRSGVNAGDTCVVTAEYIGQYAGYDMILNLKDTLNPYFLNQLINTEYMDRVVKPLTRRAAQPHLNSEQVQGFPIICVPIALQNEFASFVSQIDKSKSVIQKSLDETQLLFDSLMQEYFG